LYEYEEVELGVAVYVDDVALAIAVVQIPSEYHW
jgi:hypothetical protein